jgi:hypothetical protein
MKKLLLAITLLVPETGQAASATVSVTPETMAMAATLAFQQFANAAAEEFGAKDAARLTPAQRKIADEVVGDVIAKIQAKIAEQRRLTESIAELAKRERSQLSQASVNRIGDCAYSCRYKRVPLPEAVNEKVVDDIIFQYRNPPEGDFLDTYSHQKACVWALGELGHSKAVPVIIECTLLGLHGGGRVDGADRRAGHSRPAGRTE